MVHFTPDESRVSTFFACANGYAKAQEVRISSASATLTRPSTTCRSPNPSSECVAAFQTLGNRSAAAHRENAGGTSRRHGRREGSRWHQIELCEVECRAEVDPRQLRSANATAHRICLPHARLSTHVRRGRMTGSLLSDWSGEPARYFPAWSRPATCGRPICGFVLSAIADQNQRPQNTSRMLMCDERVLRVTRTGVSQSSGR